MIAFASNASKLELFPVAHPRGNFSPAKMQLKTGYSPFFRYVWPISKRRRVVAPRSRLRATAASKPGSNEGRITFISSLIGFSNIQKAPSKSDACWSEMKDHVIASFIPATAATRRNFRSKSWNRSVFGFATFLSGKRNTQYLVYSANPDNLLHQVSSTFDVMPT